ncbi:hypothetical protein ACHAW5_004754 [Stephanodiscus triporus]|uniref:Imidazoleglycerol-phosphate dehydratase n=1 Tax=Stephanodiscus triporus TaxID=2934178 RepID=A0ABD3MK78_9STRA
MTKKFAVTDVSCLDVSRSTHPISTGIGYLDHMIDQLNSHAQVGVSVTVVVVDDDREEDDDGDGRGRTRHDRANRYATEDQSELTSLVGSALGERLRILLSTAVDPGSKDGRRSSRFRCPLDEALVECTLATTTTTSEDDDGGGRLVDFTLPPYGMYPPDVGRSRIGELETDNVRTFFDSLARSSGLAMSLRKVRGDNGHHVVESAFKAFSRALRNLLDGTDAYDARYDPVANEAAWWGGHSSDAMISGCGGKTGRTGTVERSTRETSISVRIRLSDGVPHLDDDDDDDDDGGGATEGDPVVGVDTGLKTLDRFVSVLAREARMSVDVRCTGDLYVDDHHTSEDVAIALGQALDEALGTRAGLNRMWCAVGAHGEDSRSILPVSRNEIFVSIAELVVQTHARRPLQTSSFFYIDAEVEVTMDLSNRPHVIHDLFRSTSEEYAGDMSVEMIVHALESLATNSKSTVHIVERKVGTSALETSLATAMAYGRALRMCGAVDPRRAGTIASSKGTLSV